MWRLLIHVDYSRYDVLFANSLANKLRSPFKISCNVLPPFPVKEIRAGSNEGIHKACTVLAGATARRLYPAVNFLPVPACGPDDMEVVLAAAFIDVWVTGVLVFTPFVVGFQRSGGSAFVFLKP